MKIEKVNYVLKALQKDRIGSTTREALLKALNDDGIFDLEGVAESMLKKIRKDLDVKKTEPKIIDFEMLAKRTSPADAHHITHVIPQVAVVLDGVTYDPKDLRRFDGKPLLFIPIVKTNGTHWLQAFHEEIKDVVAGYFQTRQLAFLLNPNDFPIPGLPPQNPPGTPPGTNPPTGWPPLTGCGAPGQLPCGGTPPPPPPFTPPPPSEPRAPFTYGQVQMFEDADYGGDWFWLANGYQWTDLTRVSRGGWFGGDWNDSISSLSSTNTSCLYCEHINLEGSTLLVGPNIAKHQLSIYGWNDRISSLWNFS